MSDRSRRLRIALVSSAHPWDDVRIFRKEAKTLAAAGYDVTLIAQRDGDAVVEGVRCVAIPFTRSRLARMLLGPWRVLSKALAYDVVHFHDPELIPVALLLKLLGKRVIYDVHEDVPRQIRDKTWIPSMLRGLVAGAVAAIEWIGAHSFDKVVAATPTIAGRFPERRTVVVRNYPLLAEFAVPPSQDRGELRNFVYVGGISVSRGAREMSAAIAELHSHPDARLVLAGQSSPPNLIEDLANSPDWSRTSYLGVLDRAGVARCLANACAGLVTLHDTPNHAELLPVKMFEYMAAGLPVIASDFPLWRRIVAEDELGLLVDPLDPTAIADAMRWILQNPKEAADMGRRGRQAVHDKYDWAVEGSTLVAMYGTLQ